LGFCFQSLNIDLFLNSLDEIIHGCRHGKSNAQSQLYRLYANKMYGVCLYYSKDQEDAEDLLHDGFIRVFEQIGKYADGNFEGWMRRVFVNLALMRYRKDKRKVNVEEIGLLQESTGDVVPEVSLNASELLALISKLPPQYKLVFNLYAIEGYQHNEIAKMLDINEGTSKSNLSRARKILQDQLNKQLK
jgi:RNA polymerase sigma-70 factor (ECF subfamily)